MMPGDKPLPSRPEVIFVCCFMVSLFVPHVICRSVLADDQTPGHQTLSQTIDNWRHLPDVSPVQSPHDSTIQSPYDSNIQSPHDSNIQSPHDSNIQSPHDSTIQSPHDSNIQSPHDSTIQSPHDSNIQSPHDSTIQSPHDTNIQSPHDYTIQSPHDSNIQSPYDSNIQSPYDSNIQSPHDSTIQSSHDSNILSTHDSNIQSSDVMASPSPCDVFKDNDELIVDCRSHSLTNVSSSWFPENTTSILLDDNMLTSVPDSFSHIRHLRRLTLNYNKIAHFHLNTSSGLEHLEYLTISSVGETVFIDIDIGKLDNLSEFEVIGGEAIEITNSSFENLSKIRVLFLKELRSLLYFNSSALRPLTNLQSIYILTVQAHLHQVFDAFQCCVNRSMDNIQLQDIWVTPYEQYTSLLSGNGILTPNSTRYLRQICVRHLVLRHCAIFIIKLNALESDTWSSCLQSIDFTNNPILGTLSVMFKVVNMNNLETIDFSNAIPSNSFHRSFLTEQNTASDNWSMHRGTYIKPINDAHSVEQEVGSNNTYSILIQNSRAKQHSAIKITTGNEVGTTNRIDKHSKLTSSNQLFFPFKAVQFHQEHALTLYVSKSIKYVYISRLFLHFSLDFNVTVIGAEHLLYLDVSNGGGTKFKGQIKGLTGLSNFLLSGNDLSELNPQFFDTMPSLQSLSLSGCNLNSEYMSSFSERLFLYLQNLQHLDMSFNSLTSFSSRTFSSNPNLFEIRLSSNRFRMIPFDLANTPRLKRLDLSSNALISISAKDRRELDALASVNGGLRLFLDRNVLSCGCMDVQFLHWLQMTRVELDMARNYSCIDNDGVLTYTATLSDLEAYWRQCWGKMFLSYSLTLFCLLIIGFVLCFFVTKYKTYIISGLLNLFSETFLKKPSNYEIGVFIGYADRDYQFACHDLRQFIEDTLVLTTFIRDRDLSPSTDLASGIINAINRSWRVLLVVNETFLSQDDWFLYTCRSAISNLTPANPNLIVIMVDSQLRHRLPRDILGAVSEENIIVMNEGRRLKYDVTEKLRTRLLA